MSLADELHKLDDLRTRGVITAEEFERAKARLLDAQPAVPGPGSALNILRRSTTDRWIGGVCGGLAKGLGIESWVLRLVFAVLLFLGGTGVLLYLLLWIFVPSE
jgi:phage shock protein PspC (stress-responsive transcriptional regulator)